jgi:transcriptional regulator with XRE-family HTH domain
MASLSLGERLRERRLSQHKTLREVARTVGISTAFLSQIERGERTPSPAKLSPLAQALGLSPEQLADEQAYELDTHALLKVRGCRCSEVFRARLGFQRFYSSLRSCSVVCSAPGTFAWAGQFNGTNGGLEILSKTPCRVFVGLVKGGAGGLSVERRFVFNPTTDTFEEVKYQGDTASLWADHKESLLAALLGKKDEDASVRQFAATHSFVVVSEVPHHRGWDLAGLQAACMAAVLALALGVVDKSALRAWATAPCDALLQDGTFLKVARLAMKIQSMGHATASGGATAVCPIIGNTVKPIVYVSEMRDGHYQPPDRKSPDRCTDSTDLFALRPRAVGTHFEVYDDVVFHVSRLEELPEAEPRLSLEETLDYGLIYPGDPAPPASKILSVAAKKDHLAEIARLASEHYFKVLGKNEQARFKFLRLCRSKDARRLLGACYTDAILANSLEVLGAAVALMHRGYSSPALEDLYSAVNRNHWLGWNLGIETPVANEIWASLQHEVRRLDHAPGIGASVAGSERGGDVFFVCRWHGLRDLMPQLLAELRKFTGEKVELDYASWLDGVERDGLRVEDPALFGNGSTTASGGADEGSL